MLFDDYTAGVCTSCGFARRRRPPSSNPREKGRKGRKGAAEITVRGSQGTRAPSTYKLIITSLTYLLLIIHYSCKSLNADKLPSA